MEHEEIYTRTARNRLAIADLLESLTPQQWRADTLCAGWTVHHLAAHLLQPMTVSFARFFAVSIRYRGDTAATVDHFAQKLARRSPSDLVTQIRAHAHDRVSPPRVGPMGPFADTCIHLSDIARPLGLSANVPQGDWLELLDYLTSGKAAPSLSPSDRTNGLALGATDADWSHGTGLDVSGPLEAIAMAIAGRSSAIADLTGAGVDTLRARIAP